MTPTRIPLAGGTPTRAIRRLLEELLRRDVVDAVLVQMAQPRGPHLTHALVSDPAMLEHAQPLAPTMPVNAARLASRLSIREPDHRVAVVLRPCEERALTELVKLKQASIDSLVPVVFDCPGACPQEELERLAAESDGLDGAAAALYGAAREPGTPGPALRDGCRMCTDFVPGALADLSLELFGRSDGIGVGLSDRLAERFDLTGLDVEPTEDDGNRGSEIDALLEIRSSARKTALEPMAAMVDDPKAFLETIAGCIRCGNCQRVCPICFCKRCTFEMPHLEHEPIHYLRSAGRLGAARMPEDATLFHLTRLAHVALSCSSCGTCSAACPQGLPLTAMFVHTGQRVRRPFDYEPGRSLDEPLPLSTFEPEELEPR